MNSLFFRSQVVSDKGSQFRLGKGTQAEAVWNERININFAKAYGILTRKVTYPSIVYSVDARPFLSARPLIQKTSHSSVAMSHEHK